MDSFDYKYICKQIAKSTSSTVRVYEDGIMLYTHSVWQLNPDPIAANLNEILEQRKPYGVITTPLFQFYTFFTVHGSYRFVTGPSGLISTDKKKIGELLLDLSVPKADYENYTNALRCPPTVSIEKTLAILKLLVYSFDRIKLENKTIFFNEKADEQYSLVASSNMETSMKLAVFGEPQTAIEQTYSTELMLAELITSGSAEKMMEIQGAQPTLKAGYMAHDTLRQMKNESICGATVAARAAIKGGLDCATAFQISDLFIQKAELMTNYNSLRQLQWDLFVDYAIRVKDANHGLENRSEIFVKSAKYVQRNITQQITTEKLAQELNLSRSYLCTLFKKETSITLMQYIQTEKILEAQRLLKHTKYSLSEISDYLAFSSQSHFQTVFKKVTGKTPTKFRTDISI